MKSNNETSYYVIFDTNTLFQSYEKKADFTSFSFNSTYDNVVDMINQLDIYGQVILGIPSVVWNEMEKQIIEKHDELIVPYRSTIAKKLFPEYSISENLINDYPEYIRAQIIAYKTDLSSGFNRVVELPLATSNCFESIVNRAFAKQPPFEGKDKKSDKGFKDVLLWESILEFALAHPNSKILYYSKDNAFGEFLQNEFADRVGESTLSICKNENEVKAQLELWAKEIDKYAYKPIESYNENKAIVEWLNSGDFLAQLIDRDFGLVEKGRLISSTSIHLISIDNIEQLNAKEDFEGYCVDVTLEIDYVLKDGVRTSETISSTLYVESLDDSLYFIEDMYQTDEDGGERED